MQKHGKGRIGPGGIRCSCCRKGRTPSGVKRDTARHARHLAKKIIKNILAIAGS